VIDTRYLALGYGLQRMEDLLGGGEFTPPLAWVDAAREILMAPVREPAGELPATCSGEFVVRQPDVGIAPRPSAYYTPDERQLTGTKDIDDEL
jgi:hypothetical protein